MITIKEIAERADVSRTTVSRVLNDSGYVNEATRQRVLAVIEETGYVPSEQAKSLRTKQTKEIGVIVPKISTGTASKIVEGIDETISQKGYQIILVNAQLTKEKEIEGIKLLKSKQVDGMILLATNINDELLAEINTLKIPFVAVGQNIEGQCSIVFDDYQATKDMVTTLVEKGHTRIAFIGGPESDPAVGYWRKKAFLDTMKAQNLLVEDGWVQDGDFTVQTGYNGMKEILQHSNERPTAVVAVTDRMAIGAMKFAMEAGLHVPTELAITGMGASEMTQYITPTLTTIEFGYKQAGIQAGEQMLDKLSGGQMHKKRLTLPYRLLIRNSI